MNTKNLKCLKNENVATVFIVNYETSEVLLLMHKKFHKWIPPGGHCEEGEHPHQTAIRESFEEVGLILEDNLKTHVSTKPTLVPAPMWVQLENIFFGKPEYHLHMDYIYLAYISDRIAKTLYAKEGMEIMWCSLLDLDNLSTQDFYANTIELMKDIRDFHLPNDIYSFWIN
jgi:8-oxo-dGTP pyrophosphatase MutT (NUDIX family)